MGSSASPRGRRARRSSSDRCAEPEARLDGSLAPALGGCGPTTVNRRAALLRHDSETLDSHRLARGRHHELDRAAARGKVNSLLDHLLLPEWSCCRGSPRESRVLPQHDLHLSRCPAPSSRPGRPAVASVTDPGQGRTLLRGGGVGVAEVAATRLLGPARRVRQHRVVERNREGSFRRRRVGLPAAVGRPGPEDMGSGRQPRQRVGRGAGVRVTAVERAGDRPAGLTGPEPIDVGWVLSRYPWSVGPEVMVVSGATGHPFTSPRRRPGSCRPSRGTPSPSKSYVDVVGAVGGAGTPRLSRHRRRGDWCCPGVRPGQRWCPRSRGRCPSAK